MDSFVLYRKPRPIVYEVYCDQIKTRIAELSAWPRTSLGESTTHDFDPEVYGVRERSNGNEYVHTVTVSPQ